MFSFSVQYTAEADLLKAKDKLGRFQPHHLLIQAFCGVPTEEYLAELLASLVGTFPDAAIIGTTTAGEIINDASLDQTTVISFTRFDSTHVRSALALQNEDLFHAGQQLGSEVGRPDTKLAILFGCGIKNGGAINGEPLLAGFQEACPGVMVAGAQAGDNGKAKKTFVFTEDGFTDTGVAAASLSGPDLTAGNGFNLSWVPLGKKMTVTHAEGTCIHTIDGKPAKDIYTHYLGDRVGDRLPASAAEFPLVVHRHGMPLARHANRVLADGSLEFMAPFYNGEEVRFAFCHSGLVTASARQNYEAIESKAYKAIFIYSCLTRKWVLGKDSSVELAPLAHLAPTAGFFSYGEYYSSKGRNLFLSQTMTFLALSEGRGSGQDTESPHQTAPEFEEHETKQIQDLQALHRLIETSAEERESLIRELQAAVSEIKTLRGFIPICANCKSIRDDQGFWNRVEQYIQIHTDAQFSHGICPDCAKKLYPEFYQENGNRDSGD